MTLGKKLKDMWTIMERITWKELLKHIILNFKLTQLDIAELENGKCMLTRTLCLPLLLVLRHQLETGPYRTPPSTPFPNSQQRNSHPPPTPQNGHHPGQRADGTGAKYPVLSAPPAGRDKKPRGDQGPDHRGDNSRPGEGSDGGEPDPPQGTPPTPPTVGEGEVEGHPQGPNRAPTQEPNPDPDPDREALLPQVALMLQMWENHYNQLVENILGALKDYWQKLMTPQ